MEVKFSYCSIQYGVLATINLLPIFGCNLYAFLFKFHNICSFQKQSCHLVLH